MELKLNHFIPVVITKPIQSIYALYQFKKNSPEKTQAIDELTNKTKAIAAQCFTGAALALVMFTNIEFAVPVTLLGIFLLDRKVMMASINGCAYVISIALVITGIASSSFLCLLTGTALGVCLYRVGYRVGLDLEKAMENQDPYYSGLKSVIFG